MGQQTVGIITYKVPGLKPWDPDTIHRGITGSEEAVIYVSQKLAAIGFKVVVFGDPPPDSVHSSSISNPRFMSLDRPYPGSLDIAISWRMPHIAKELKRHVPKVYFWPADTMDRRLPKEMIEAFDGVLWLSEWQRKQWMSINPAFADFTSVFGNGINPEDFQDVQERENPYSCIYGSNYARGLEIMLDIWPAVKEQYPQATLDIYYGWQHWGCLSPEKEEKMREQIPRLKDVCDHGLVGHLELNRAYGQASFWTYPCIRPETFCITAIRAQMSGAIPVIIEGSALSETVKHGYKCHDRNAYLSTLISAMSAAKSIGLDDRRKMKEFILQEYTWEKIAAGWQKLFNENNK